jgi:hypothetical protein
MGFAFGQPYLDDGHYVDVWSHWSAFFGSMAVELCDLNQSTQHTQRTSLLGFDIARSYEGTLRGATIRLGRLSFALWHGPTRQLNIPWQFRQDLVHNLSRKFCYLTGIVSVSFAGVCFQPLPPIAFFKIANSCEACQWYRSYYSP